MLEETCDHGGEASRAPQAPAAPPTGDGESMPCLLVIASLLLTSSAAAQPVSSSNTPQPVPETGAPNDTLRQQEVTQRARALDFEERKAAAAERQADAATRALSVWRELLSVVGLAVPLIIGLLTIRHALRRAERTALQNAIVQTLAAHPTQRTQNTADYRSLYPQYHEFLNQL